MNYSKKITIPATEYSKERFLVPRTMVFTELPTGSMFCKYTGRGMTAETFYGTYCGAAALDGIVVKIAKAK